VSATATPVSIATSARRSERRKVRVAHINANFTAGSGGITLREATALDDDRYSSTILAPEDGTLFERAESAGVEVVRLRQMAAAGGSIRGPTPRRLGS